MGLCKWVDRWTRPSRRARDLLRSHFVAHIAGGEGSSRFSQGCLDSPYEGVRAAEHAPRDPFRLLERRHGLAEIVERGGGVLEERRRV